MKETNETVFVSNGRPELIREVGDGCQFTKEYIELRGKETLLYSGRAIGSGSFHLHAKLMIPNSDDTPTFAIDAKGLGINGFRRIKSAAWPEEILRHQHMSILPEWVTLGVPFTFEVIRKVQRVVVMVDKIAVKHFLYGRNPCGEVGFCAHGGVLRIYDFYVGGEIMS